ncbi:MAG: DNA mismatch repair protein MutS [Gemmatimonadales bacterium]|nr:DNA mismatch repair protein MutS [Gemmatimonadales bacterium]
MTSGNSPKKDSSAGKSGSNAKLTPMLTQYMEIKAQHPGCLLLFRMGDFYETFFEDAQTMARVAGVNLTSRDAKSDHPVPLAGVPFHALETYLNRLLVAGITVAICEQVEDPALAKGLVKREVVEIISPGTITAEELIDESAGHYCLAWLPQKTDHGGWALLDASTGEFRCGLEQSTLAGLCLRHPVREVIVREDTPGPELSRMRLAVPQVVITPVNSAWFHPSFARQTLLDHFQVANLAAFGLEEGDRQAATATAGALLRYLESLSLGRPRQISSLRFADRGDRLVLDEETLRNLEIFRTFRGEKGEGTLIHHVDGTVTAMGHRLLARRLAEALTDTQELAHWHAGVDSALQDRTWRRNLREILGGIGDLERLATRAATSRIGPSSLRLLGESLEAVMRLAKASSVGEHDGHLIHHWAEKMADFSELAAELLTAISPEAGSTTRKGGYISSDVSDELDRCRSITADTKGFLAGLQAKEREATGIPTLKVGFNRVFGYYFEITRKHLDRVPDHFSQKQTLVNSSRFHTEELKEAEATILDAEERAGRLEEEIFNGLLDSVGPRQGEIHESARLVALIDLLLGFAEVAERNEYCRPVCNDSLDLSIKGGRHPVVENLLDCDFIPNNTEVGLPEQQLLLLTGPNMGGKSTYLRQVALIALLAQTGSFVPADSAKIGVADRIFTRVGASDNLARGESTFYMEMSETAHILHQMTSRSLVILDEIGRGTSTYDGLSLAWGITEYLCHPAGPRPRSIFATHYHELTELENDLPGLVNLRLEVKEWEGRIIFLHAVGPGRSDKSYGIHVARLAGLPEPVLRRSEEILASLSTADERDLSARTSRNPRTPGGASLAADSPLSSTLSGRPTAQLSLFNEVERDALDALKGMDLEKISPMDAFMWLAKIKEQLTSRGSE